MQGSAEGLLLRFTSSVTYLSVDSSHSRLAAASCNFSIKIVDLSDTAKVVTLTSHAAPVLCAEFDPTAKFMVGH